MACWMLEFHDDVIEWNHFPRYWPFVRGIHRSPVNSPHKGQWRRALVCSLFCACISGWINNRTAGDLRRYRAHYDVTVMLRVKMRSKVILRCETIMNLILVCVRDQHSKLQQSSVLFFLFLISLKWWFFTYFIIKYNVISVIVLYVVPSFNFVAIILLKNPFVEWFWTNIQIYVFTFYMIPRLLIVEVVAIQDKLLHIVNVNATNGICGIC